MTGVVLRFAMGGVLFESGAQITSIRYDVALVPEDGINRDVPIENNAIYLCIPHTSALTAIPLTHKLAEELRKPRIYLIQSKSL